MQRVVIVNSGSGLHDAQVAEVVAAIQKQVREHFCPAWGIDADVVFQPDRAECKKTDWVVALVADSDQPDALGYHELHLGEPDAVVAVKTTTDEGGAWTVVLSHEVLEMLADPFLLTAAVQVAENDGKVRIVAVEVCDPCEGDDAAYVIDGVKVSDFVLPSWFDPTASAPYDQAKLVKKPGDLLPGGYISILDGVTQSGWRQIFARKSLHCRDRIAARHGGRTPALANAFDQTV